MQRVISGLGREVAQTKRIKYRCSLYSEHLLLPRDKAFCFNFFIRIDILSNSFNNY